MDIAKAFDSVKISSLINMLETIEVPTVSTYYKYIQLLPRIFHKNQGAFANLFKMKYKKQAVEDGKFPFFKDLLLRKDSLNVLTSRTSFSTSEKIKLVTRVLQGNLIGSFLKLKKEFLKGFHVRLFCRICIILVSNKKFLTLSAKSIQQSWF